MSDLNTLQKQYRDLFSAITLAALQLSLAGDHAAMAAALRREIDNSFFLNPTAAQQYLAKRDSVENQLKLLDAAASFLSTFINTLGPDHHDVQAVMAAKLQAAEAV